MKRKAEPKKHQKNKGGQELYINRELSWLKFNERVLEEAERPNVPLCERLNFLSIYQSNLDEFFMVRVGSLIDRTLLSKKRRDDKTRLTAEEQLSAVLRQVREQRGRTAAVYAELTERLAEQGIRLMRPAKLKKSEREFLEAYFDREIAPLLSPSIVGRRQPFPFLRNREIYAAVILIGRSGKEKLGILPCGAGVFPRLVPVSGESGTYVLSEELLLHFVPKIFRGYRIKCGTLLRVTRSADIDPDALYDEDTGYREFMETVVKLRKRLFPVRLELSRGLDKGGRETLCRDTGVQPELVFHAILPLDLSFFLQIRDMLRRQPELFYEKRLPRRAAPFPKDCSVLRQIREKDRLLCYPYDSMLPFLELLWEAAYDENVVSVKMTLYRVARQSKVVEALIEAAENGKEVLVLVELKARFDEENNIEWSRRLENAGCQVIYGLEGYKVHAKLCLIVRRTEEGSEYYTQIGTGNYNEATARLYTDFSLMTADPEIGTGAAAIFRSLALGETAQESGPLLAAPANLQKRLLELIDGEIVRAQSGEPAYIGLKLNALTDKTLIDRLIAASQAGVTIDMVVRGICCLRPGIKNATENIRVVSVVGRFLEHSRLYIFGIGERRSVYLSSADFMTRNMLRRVEVAAPVRDADVRNRLIETFRLLLRDNRQARMLLPDGSYVPVRNDEPPTDAQAVLLGAAELT
ncbi:MAG: polyphosphate kinase 1 [Lachnospiraceae bacterium]|nr:polyphosphate kinase 1 [Lachnospiraceae bacterium]